MTEPADSADGVERKLLNDGWALFPLVIPPQKLGPLRNAIIQSVEDCGRLQVSSGAAAKPDGTAHHSVGQYPALDAFLDQHYLAAEVDRYFGGAPYILHAFNPATVAPESSSYLHRVHRDIGTFSGDFRLKLNMLVMVDDFTLENGATHVLSGSHRRANPPDEMTFARQAERLVGPAGSIVLFDSQLWHAAGQNFTDQVRCALTLSFSRAFVKPQMDYARLLGAAYAERLSPRTRQILGYNAMVATNLEEWYRPREARLYKADQG